MPSLLDRLARLLRPAPARAPAFPRSRAVRSVAEEYMWLAASRCACGGAWRVLRQHALRGPRGIIDVLDARCASCGGEGSFRFELR